VGWYRPDKQSPSFFAPSSPKMVFCKRVTVLDPTNGRVVDTIDRHTAQRRYSEGVITPYLERKNSGIYCVHRVETLVNIVARPGSYGIAVEELGDTRRCYAHHGTYESSFAKGHIALPV
jgi:hypothetical protein